MQPISVPLGPWLPDQPDQNNPGLVEAKNVYRLNGAYQPQRDIEFPGGNQSKDLGITTSGTDVYAAMSATDGSLPSYAIAVGNSPVNLLAFKAASSGTVTTTAISTAIEAISDFVNFDGDIYYFARDSKQYKSASGAAFALVSSASQFGATSAARLGSFIMTGHNFGIKWSGFNAPEDWAISQRTMAGEGVVNSPELGRITSILGGKTNYLFQEFGVTRVEFVAGAKVWNFVLLSSRYGAVKGTPIEVGGLTYFIGASGPSTANYNGTGQLHLLVTNGADVQDISTGILSDWLGDNFTSDASVNMGQRSVVFDAANRRIIWSSGVGGEATGFTDGTHKFLCMNVDTQEFSYFEGAYQLLVPGPFHHKDNGGQIVGIADNGGNLHYGPLTGDTLEATLTKGHLSSAGRRTTTSIAEVDYQGSGATLAVSGKSKLSGASDFGAYDGEDSSTGLIPARSSGRATAVSVKFAAGEAWSDARGVTIETRVEGKQ